MISGGDLSALADRPRMEAMGRFWEERPGAPLPVIFPERAEQEAAYRLLSNPRVSMDDILESHREIATERCKVVGVVLLIPDTTMCKLQHPSVFDRGPASRGLRP